MYTCMYIYIYIPLQSPLHEVCRGLRKADLHVAPPQKTRRTGVAIVGVGWGNSRSEEGKTPPVSLPSGGGAARAGFQTGSGQMCFATEVPRIPYMLPCVAHLSPCTSGLPRDQRERPRTVAGKKRCRSRVVKLFVVLCYLFICC